MVKKSEQNFKKKNELEQIVSKQSNCKKDSAFKNCRVLF